MAERTQMTIVGGGLVGAAMAVELACPHRSKALQTNQEWRSVPNDHMMGDTVSRR